MFSLPLLCIFAVAIILTLAFCLPFLEKILAKKLNLTILSKKHQATILVGALIVCAYALGVHSHSRLFALYKDVLGSELPIIFAVRILMFSLLYTTLTFCSKLVTSSALNAYPVKSNKVCLLITIGFTVLLLALWGIEGTHASNDYSGQIASARMGEYDKAHPVSHTLFCCCLLSIYDSIHTIIISQILFYALSVYAISWFCKRAEISIFFTITATFLATICTYQILLLAIKDSFFISSCTIATVGLMSWCLTPSRKAVLLTTIGLIGVGIFRYDGQAIVILTATALIMTAFVRRQKIRQILIMSIVPCIIIILAHVILPGYLNATSRVVGTKMAMPAEIVCEVIAQNGNISKEELSQAEEIIMPKEMIIKHHGMSAEYDGRKYMWAYFSNQEELETYSFAYRLSGKEKELLPLAITVALKNPVITIRHFIEQGRMVWDPSMQYKQPTAFFFFVNLVLLCILFKCNQSPIYYIPFIPVLTVALTSTFVATTFEPRYTFPIFFGGALSIAYTHFILRLGKGK